MKTSQTAKKKFPQNLFNRCSKIENINRSRFAHRCTQHQQKKKRTLWFIVRVIIPVKSQPIVYHSVILVRILIVNICHDRDHESRTKTARAAKCNTLLGCGDYSFVGKTTIIRKQILTKYHEKVLKKFVLCNLIGFFQEDFKTVTMVFYKDPDHKKNLKYSKKT